MEFDTNSEKCSLYSFEILTLEVINTRDID